MTSLQMDIEQRHGDFVLRAAFETPLTGVTAVFGPSGSGKSQLLCTLAGLRQLQSGRIALGGRVLDDVAARVHVPPHLRGIGLVFQHTRLFPHLSVEKNLLYAQRRADQFKPLMTLDQATRDFDIAELLRRPVRNLSGGERGRVALARAILSAPQLLLLDEPFAALDGPRRTSFLVKLRHIHEKFGLPLVVVTHQIDDVAALADHVVGLRSGKVIAHGALASTATLSPFQSLLDQHDVGAVAPAHAFRGATSVCASHWIRADHVLLATQQPVGLSARNIWEATVIDIKQEQNSLLVSIDAPFGRLFSRVTQDAAADLALNPGQRVWAIIKAHAA